MGLALSCEVNWQGQRNRDIHVLSTQHALVKFDFMCLNLFCLYGKI